MSAASSRPYLVLKVLAGLLLLAVALMVAAIFVGLSSSFQESMLRRQLVKAGATDIQLEAVHATVQAFTARRIAFTQKGLKLDASDVEIRYHLRRLLDHEIDLDAVTGRNLDVTLDPSAAAHSSASDASSPTPTRSASASPFPFQLPYKVVLGKLDVSGEVTVHLGAAQVQTGQWHLTGGSLAPGATGNVRLEFHPSAPAFVHSSGGTVTLSATLPQSPAGQIDSTSVNVAAEELPLVWANLVANTKGVQINDGQLSAKVLAAVHAFGMEEVRRNVVRGQYGTGTVEGKKMDAYRSAASIAPRRVTNASAVQ